MVLLIPTLPCGTSNSDSNWFISHSNQSASNLTGASSPETIINGEGGTLVSQPCTPRLLSLPPASPSRTLPLLLPHVPSLYLYVPSLAHLYPRFPMYSTFSHPSIPSPILPSPCILHLYLPFVSSRTHLYLAHPHAPSSTCALQHVPLPPPHPRPPHPFNLIALCKSVRVLCSCRCIFRSFGCRCSGLVRLSSLGAGAGGVSLS